MFSTQLWIEAFIVGIILILVSYPIMAVTKKLSYEGEGKYIGATFLIGVVTHILFEAMGANAWYCKNGAACQSDKTE